MRVCVCVRGSVCMCVCLSAALPVCLSFCFLFVSSLVSVLLCLFACAFMCLVVPLLCLFLLCYVLFEVPGPAGAAVQGQVRGPFQGRRPSPYYLGPEQAFGGCERELLWKRASLLEEAVLYGILA